MYDLYFILKGAACCWIVYAVFFLLKELVTKEDNSYYEETRFSDIDSGKCTSNDRVSTK